MSFLVGSVLLLALTALANAETCSQVMQCIDHAQNIKTAAQSGNMDAMCDTQQKMVNCFSSALADCQNSGTNFPKSTLDQLQTSMNQARKEYEAACAGRGSSSGGSGPNSGGSPDSGSRDNSGSGGMTYGKDSGSYVSSGSSVPETATCTEVTKCVFDMMKLQSSLNEENIQEACAVLKPSTKCFKSAYEDCKEKNVLAERELNAMAKQSNEINALYSEHCGGASGLGVSTVFMTLISALAFIVVRLF